MRGEALHAGIEGEVLAAVFPGVFDQPIEERGSISARAVGIMGNEVVDVESAPGEKEIENAEAGDRTDCPVELEIGELIAFFLLLKNARGEIDRLDVRPQLAHD